MATETANAPVEQQIEAIVAGVNGVTLEESPAHAASESTKTEGVKVYVGNIPFKYRNKDLKELINSDAALKCQIVARGHRSSGYGFVTFDSIESAQQVIDTLNGTELEGREIVVELAKKKETSPASEKSVDGEKAAAPKATKAPKAKKPFAKGRSELSGAPSKTLLFVSNLPFSFTSENLEELFTSKGLPTKSAVIITRKYGATAGRSKGFGFAEVLSEADQAKAIELLSETEIDGRVIQVKVALERDPPAAETPAEAASEVVETSA